MGNPRKALIIFASVLALYPVSSAQCGLSDDTLSVNAQRLPTETDQSAGKIICHLAAPTGQLAIEAFATKAALKERENGDIAVHYRVISGDRLPGKFRINSDEIDPDILWDATGAKFALTTSNSGLVGQWRTKLFRMKDGSFRPSEPFDTVRADFAKSLPVCRSFAGKHRCDSESMHNELAKNPQEWVNVWPIEWLKEDSEIALLANVPNSSEFGVNMGESSVYLVSATDGHILDRLSNRDAEKRFAASTRRLNEFLFPE